MNKNNNKDSTRAIADLERLFYAKGYLHPFILVTGSDDRPMPRGSLHDCLQAFLTRYEQTQEDQKELRIETHARYKDPQDHICCSFIMRYDGKRFSVRHLMVSDAQSGGTRQYRFNHNHQLPGAATLHGFFPKPKPWSHLFKGKFRGPKY